MQDGELLKIGQRYNVHGRFNYSRAFHGTLAAVSTHFLGWTDCEGLARDYGEDQKEFITEIDAVQVIAPDKE
jgi:hypothetical protein